MVLTALSRVLGMLRDMAFAYFLGAGGLMDGWAIAFKIPNLARRLFGEGAAASSLIPVYSEQLHRDPRKANRFAMSVVTAVFVLLAAVTLLGEAFLWLYYHFLATQDGARLKLALTGLMLPYMVLICVVAILGGMLNTHRHFAVPAAAPAVLNVFLIVGSVPGRVGPPPAATHDRLHRLGGRRARGPGAVGDAGAAAVETRRLPASGVGRAIRAVSQGAAPDGPDDRGPDRHPDQHAHQRLHRPVAFRLGRERASPSPCWAMRSATRSGKGRCRICSMRSGSTSFRWACSGSPWRPPSSPT